jgi:hypothetical protein
VGQFQLVQQAQDRIVLRYSGDHDISGLPETASVAAVIGQIHGDTSKFSVERVDGFPSARKFQAFLREELSVDRGERPGPSRPDRQQP